MSKATKTKKIDLTPEQAQELYEDAVRYADEVERRLRDGENVDRDDWRKARDEVEFALLRVEGAKKAEQERLEEARAKGREAVRDWADENLPTLALELAEAKEAAVEAMRDWREAHAAYSKAYLRVRNDGKKLGAPQEPNPVLWVTFGNVGWGGDKTAHEETLFHWLRAIVYEAAEGQMLIDERGWAPGDCKPSKDRIDRWVAHAKALAQDDNDKEGKA